MDFRAIIMGVLFAVMWSSAFSSARIIVADAPPMAALAVRFLISGGIAVGMALWLGQPWRLTREQWRLTILFGVCQNALYLGLNFVAMQTVEASLAAIIASSLPLWVALSGWLISGETVRPLGIAGLVAGFAGVAVIMGTRLSAGVDPFGVALCGIGVLALTFATLALRGASSGGNVLMIVGLQMLVGSAVLFVPAILLETWTINPSWVLAAAFTYTVFVPGLAATIVWFVLVRRIGTVRASTFHFLNPFLGVAIAALLLGEALGTLDILGVLIITLGILAVQLSKVPEAATER
ncbi:MAG: DMT family transporter [Paracoccaceae bacterium]|nr:DMT family transporter [Paracoccaceae bacterium]